jgi:hypothetical protein
VLAIPGTRLGQDGAQEKTVLYPVSLFDRVARVVKPRRRCHLSPEQLARLGAAGARSLRAWREANDLERISAAPSPADAQTGPGAA